MGSAVSLQTFHDFRDLTSHAIFANYPRGITAGIQDGSKVGATSAYVSIINVRGWEDSSAPQACSQWFSGYGAAGIGVRIPKLSSNGSYYYESVPFWTTDNTTKTSDGTLKAASPVVKLFGDGRFQLNDESEDCTVSRLSVGEYLIEGCTGLNADAAWGGIDGGFDIPTDRNKQPLIWLDYEVNADGSILVKTYHRTHPAAPAFARNEIPGLLDGNPVDIPADQYISVRVQMNHEFLSSSSEYEIV